MTTVRPEIIDTPQAIVKLVDQLISIHEARNESLDPPIMHISLEGVNLCRNGTVSILTLLLHESPSSQQTYLIDVHSLGAQTFSTAGANGKTLKHILQDEKMPKVFFDVRIASAGLFAHYCVALEGVQDVQLMDSAAVETTESREYLSWLAACVKYNKIISYYHYTTWSRDREAGEQLFRPELGGSYDVFNQRPLPDDIIKYCVGSVECLPKLRNELWGARRLGARRLDWRDMVQDETDRRVVYSHAADYQPGGTDWVLAPWTDDQNMVLDMFNLPSDSEDDFFDCLENDEVEDDVERGRRRERTT
ncbi:hypothetical protein J4E85_008319 [Alternaria conjuncta]|uniref:uncharacterized protein n=1 Tax=Alternaria conjuncta TaxID=181017 RepID=UPI00221F12E7|nr:uncharacterized protein J4E85_008319 [Alternaria conjuncta]KAI4923282.1 hypothetical protein J4E85_008319 [Alternaria conjuncta]